MEQDSYPLLLNYAFRMLSRKAYTVAELKKRLERRAIKVKLPGAPSTVEKVITRLGELNYLNDAKILEDYFEYRLPSRPQGKFLFLHEMHRKGIPLDKAREAWDKRNIEEKSLAFALIKIKKRQLEKLPEAVRKKKIAQLLASRGFAPDTVWSVLEPVRKV